MSFPAVFAQLRRDAVALTERFVVAGDGTQQHAGIDPAGTVCVSVDDRGLVAAVELARSWRGSPDLGGAVVEALWAATRSRLAAWAHATDARAAPEALQAPIAAGVAASDNYSATTVDTVAATAADGHASALGPVTPGRRPHAALADLTSDVDVAALTEFTYLVLDAVERLPRHAVGARPGPTRHACGPASITVVGGEVTAVELDRRWLTRATPKAVAEEIRRAVNTALIEPRGVAPRDATLRELHDATTDPGVLLHGLGLGR